MARAKKPTAVEPETQRAAVEAETGQGNLRAPSFGMCEGTREELLRTGKAIDPFTGQVLTRADLK